MADQYYCSVSCTGVDKVVAWNAHPCGAKEAMPCPAIPSEVPKDDPRRKKDTFGLIPGDFGEVDDAQGAIKAAVEATKAWAASHGKEVKQALVAKGKEDGRKKLSEFVKEGSPEAAKQLGWIKGSASGLPAGSEVNLQGL